MNISDRANQRKGIRSDCATSFDLLTLHSGCLFPRFPSLHNSTSILHAQLFDHTLFQHGLQVGLRGFLGGCKPMLPFVRSSFTGSVPFSSVGRLVSHSNPSSCVIMCDGYTRAPTAKTPACICTNKVIGSYSKCSNGNKTLSPPRVS